MNFARAKKSRRLVLLVAGLVVLGVGLGLAIPKVLQALAKAQVEKKIEELSLRIHREIKAGQISSGLIEGLVIERVLVEREGSKEPEFYIDRIRLDFSLWDVLWGKREPSKVVIEGLSGRILVERWLKDALKGVGGEVEGGHGLSWGALPEVMVSGEVLLIPEDSTRAPWKITALSVSGRAVAGAYEIMLSGLLQRGEVGAIKVFSKMAIRSFEDLEGLITFEEPVEFTALAPARFPFPLKMAAVEWSSGQGESTVTIKDLEVPNVFEVRENPLIGQLFSHGGPISAREVSLSFRRSLWAAAKAGISGALGTLKRATLKDASAHLLPVHERLGPIRLMEMWAAFEEGTLKVSSKASAGKLGPSDIMLEIRGDLREGDLEGKVSVRGPLLVEVASKFHPKLLSWPGVSVEVDGEFKKVGDKIDFSGHLSGRHLSYFWTKICLVPVTGLEFDGDLSFEYDLSTGHFFVRTKDMSAGWRYRARMDLEVSGDLSKNGPRLDIHVAIPEQSCGELAAAIPPVLIPRLEGARFEGVASFDFRLIADMANPDRSRLEVRPDVSRCQAVTLGPLVHVEDLNSDQYVFEIVVREPKDQVKRFRVGPGTEDYVPISEIPVVVQQAALATEDMAFFKHEGFRIGLINRAVRLNLSKGWYVYGGSTISQQLVKNLFLSREKTLARKLEEAIIVWVMEQKVEKERILELYLNCIEFGKEIYGIKAAAKAYFNKEPKDLTAIEAAFIMATKPAPKYAYKVYQSRAFNEWWVKRIQGILERLWKEMDVIDERTAHTPDPCPPDGPRGKYLVPCFYYPEEDLYAQPAVAPGTEVPPGMPEEIPGGNPPASP